MTWGDAIRCTVFAAGDSGVCSPCESGFISFSARGETFLARNTLLQRLVTPGR